MELMLDDIVLPQFMVPVNQLYAPAVDCEAEPTRAGGKVRWFKPLKEMPFDVQCPENVFCTGGLLDDLRNLAESDTATSTHILTLSADTTSTYTVKLRLEETDWLSAKPLREYVPQSEEDIYGGLTIKLARLLD